MQEKKLHSLPLKTIQIDDSYWNKYTRLVPNVVIPYQWEILNDRVTDAEPSHCLKNFQIAAGEATGERQGTAFLDTDVAKWLEAVAYSLEISPNPELEATADQVIALIGRAQCEDGYINTYFTLKENGRRWENLSMGHELYTAGHLTEAAVAYYYATGKNEFLNIMCRFADLICKEFGPAANQRHGYPGHQEIELALIKLYRATGNRNYLETAKYFIDARGGTPNYFEEEIKRPGFKPIYTEDKEYFPVYSQSDKPVRDQTVAEGHAVRAVYMYCAMADLAYEYQDQELLDRCDILWNDIVGKQMYINGSIGSCSVFERFTIDYDLPNDLNYSETCASIGLALFGLRMSQIKRDASYFNTVERSLYNTVRSGISLEGNRYFYVNPLEVWPDSCMEYTAKAHVKPVRQKWFDVACCPTNVARTLTSLGQYIYSCDENSLYLNLFIQNHTALNLAGTNVDVSLQADFPKSSNMTMRVKAEQPVSFPLYIRIPNYAKNFTLCVNGQQQDYTVVNSFACLERQWNDDQITISFEMPAHFVRANPNVRADCGKIALVRGPELYCLEEVDNGKNLASIFIDPAAEITEEYHEDLFGGAMTLHCMGQKLVDSNWQDNELYKEAAPEYEALPLTFVPYCYWCNRQPGEMIVWIHSKI